MDLCKEPARAAVLALFSVAHGGKCRYPLKGRWRVILKAKWDAIIELCVNALRRSPLTPFPLSPSGEEK